MRTLLYLLLSVSILISTSCKSNKEVVEEVSEQSMAVAGESTPIFTLSTGGCFGNCPIYTFTMNVDRTAMLEKKRHLPNLGKYEMTLDETTFMSIIRDLDKAKFMKMKEVYESQIPDLSLTKMTYTKAGTTKAVEGKETLPQELRAIQDQVERIIKSPGWNQIEAYEEETDLVAKELIMHEIIIQPNQGVALSRWIKRYSDYKLRLLKRIDEEDNLWLFTFDTNAVEPRKFMAALQKDPDVKHAEFNVKVSEER